MNFHTMEHAMKQLLIQSAIGLALVAASMNMAYAQISVGAGGNSSAGVSVGGASVGAGTQLKTGSKLDAPGTQVGIGADTMQGASTGISSTKSDAGVTTRTTRRGDRISVRNGSRVNTNVNRDMNTNVNADIQARTPRRAIPDARLQNSTRVTGGGQTN